VLHCVGDAGQPLPSDPIRSHSLPHVRIGARNAKRQASRSLAYDPLRAKRNGQFPKTRNRPAILGGFEKFDLLKVADLTLSARHRPTKERTTPQFLPWHQSCFFSLLIS
jgi:hypothetical protein